MGKFAVPWQPSYNNSNTIHSLDVFLHDSWLFFFNSSFCLFNLPFSSSPPLCLSPPLCSSTSAGLAQRHPADPAASSLAAAHPHLSPTCHCHPRLHEQHTASRQLEVSNTASLLLTDFGEHLLMSEYCGLQFSNPPFLTQGFSWINKSNILTYVIIKLQKQSTL